MEWWGKWRGLLWGKWRGWRGAFVLRLSAGEGEAEAEGCVCVGQHQWCQQRHATIDNQDVTLYRMW